MKKLIIFGTGQIGELAHFYFSRFSDYEIAASCVDGEYVQEDSFMSVPVIATEDIVNTQGPDSCDLFVAISYAKLNALRASKCDWALESGYALASYISPQATVLTDYPIGHNAFILEDNTIQPFVRIGNNVTLWSGNHIGHHSSIEDNCFIASHVVISGGVTIGANSFLGVNATIAHRVTVAPQSIVGAGALIIKSGPEKAVYKGPATDPARVTSDRIRL
jgi:sugar O-acyltransferase (sialic acid O-acetyltransferase NeuD family)